MTVNLCYNASEPNVGLEMNADRFSVKCYLGDTGLLVSQAFSENELAAKSIHEHLLAGDLSLNEGMIVENVVAQMLRAAGHKLYFYSRSDREDAENRMEIDFLLAKSQTEKKHNIIPIEVKSAKSYTFKSLKKFVGKHADSVSTPHVLHVKDVRVDDEGVIRLPIYMTPLLLELRT